MDPTYLLPIEEVDTLEEIRKNHKDYSTRQRASLVLLGLVDRSFQSGRQFATTGLNILVDRYKKYGFPCLLPNWDLKYIQPLPATGSGILIGGALR